LPRRHSVFLVPAGCEHKLAGFLTGRPDVFVYRLDNPVAPAFVRFWRGKADIPFDDGANRHCDVLIGRSTRIIISCRLGLNPVFYAL
jgi:hypothetical protein